MKTRTRRGKTVPIPDQWVGNFTTRKTINDRKIKAAVKKLASRVRLRDAEVDAYLSQLED